MNCPGCGAETGLGSNFCKQCGRSVNSKHTSELTVNPSRLTGMFWAVAIFALGSLSILLGTVLPMVLSGIDGQIVMPIVGLGMTATVVIAALLIKQLSRLITVMEGSPTSSSRRTFNQTGVPQAPQLGAPVVGMSSVTEHTTRNFDAAALKEREMR